MCENLLEPQWFSHLPLQNIEHCERYKQMARLSRCASAGDMSPLARGAARAMAAKVAMRRVSFMVKVGGADMLGVLVVG